MKTDAKVRPLTVNDSNTNKAWGIWQEMTPIQKFEMSQKFSSISDIKKRQNAIVNHIEDTL